MDLFANALHAYRAGRHEMAMAMLENLLAAMPAHVEALHLLGVLTAQAGDAERGAALLGRAAKLKPADIELKLKTAAMLRMAGKLDEAESLLRAMIRRKPGQAAQTQLAALLLQRGQFAEAAGLYTALSASSPGDAALRFNLGLAHQKQGKYAEAARSFARLTDLNPTDWQAWFALGECQLMLQDYHAAEQALARVQALKPDFERLYKALAALHMRRENWAGVEAAFREGLGYFPEDARLNLGFSVFLLGMGRWQEGLQYYVRRNDWKTGKTADCQVLPAAALAQQSVFIRQDQGLGDELMFLRFAARLKEQGAKTLYYVSPQLQPMLQGHPALDELVLEGEPYPAADVAMLTSDLPLVCGVSEENDIPPPLPLVADAGVKQDLLDRLRAFGAPPYIGVTWEAGVRGDDYAMHKLVDARELGKVLQQVKATYVLLQRNPDTAQMQAFLTALGKPALDMTALNADLYQMLALLDVLDDYVGVSNTNMHLRASLGKTARVLLPYPPEWRWMTEDRPSPWMPGFKTYRQTRDLAWSAALQKLEMALLEIYGRNV